MSRVSVTFLSAAQDGPIRGEKAEADLHVMSEWNKYILTNVFSNAGF